MFVGHALLAFALAVLFADWRGWPARRALTLGVAAGAFAALPDVDVVYALVAIDLAGLDAGSLTSPSTFWDATRDAHRSMTHSLVVAAVAGPAFGLWAIGDADRTWVRTGAWLGAVAGLAALVAVAAVASGALGTFVMGAFVLGGAGVATLCRTRTDLPGRTVAVVATAGLLSHPWGDLITGDPPRLFYPFSSRLFEGSVVLHADPTIHLLGAFALELGVIWLALLALVRVSDVRLERALDRRATVGAGYGVTAVVLTPPTLAVSYHFVVSILSVGMLCGGLLRLPVLRGGLTARGSIADAPWPSVTDLVSSSAPSVAGLRSARTLEFATTALAAVTAALVGYAAVYALAVAPVT